MEEKAYKETCDRLNKFIARQIKAKKCFRIVEISKNEAFDFVKKYHYLQDAKFFSQQAFALMDIAHDTIYGVATFAPPQGIVSLKGWFGLTNDNIDIYELSRLALIPPLNGTNASSFLLGGAIKELKKQGKIRAIVTLADSSRHVGSIYQVCNFKYYGLTNKKTDFYCVDGRVNPRGKTKELQGVWLPRTQKHRYAYILDDTLKVLYKEEPKPTKDDKHITSCCNGLKKVYDNRFHKWYTCPKCCGKLEPLDE